MEISNTHLPHAELKELLEKSGSEVAAASGLTELFASTKQKVGDAAEEFEIPQRFTKNGRKRAVPLPLKVSQTSDDFLLYG